MRRSKTVRLVQYAIFAALLCVLSPITVPIGPIPVTMGVFAVMLSASVLGAESIIPVIVFLLLGILGLPLFSGGNSGIAVLIGPTGGYVWSYPLFVLLAGFLCGFPCKNRWLTTLKSFFGCLAGLTVCYACGTLQYSLLAGIPFVSALSVCVLPFALFDCLKAAAASFLGVQLRSLCQRNGWL